MEESLIFAEAYKKNDIASAPLIYLVDNDDDFCEEMVAGLSRLGLNAHGFQSAEALYRAYAAKPSQIIVLELDLKGEDGLSIAAHLQSSQSVGIIMAIDRKAIEDRVASLQKGADICLVKPIDVRELAATVVALNKRVSGNRKAPSTPPSPQWTLMEGGRTLTDGLGHRLRLTLSEHSAYWHACFMSAATLSVVVRSSKPWARMPTTSTMRGSILS